MLQTLRFDIPGEPCAQGRPRFTTINGHARAYDPEKSRNYKSYVKMLAQEAVMKNGWKYTELPLSIKITCSLPIPSSKSKKFKGAAITGKIFPNKKPDIDNLFKTITDALTGVVYKDDKQIITAVIAKFYGEEPNCRVQITALGSDTII